MLVLTLIICQIIVTSAKIFNYPDNEKLDQENEILVTEDRQTDEAESDNWDDPLWVLKLNDRGLNFTYLRSATVAEEEYFDAEVGSLMDKYPLEYNNYKERQATKRIKKDNPEKPCPTDQLFHGTYASSKEHNSGESNEAKNNIIKIINKFVLSYRNEPDSNQLESVDVYDTPTITLFFKGPFTTLMVNYQRKQWQFFIRPPSPLPEWFYSEHLNTILNKYGMYVKIPDEIKEEFQEKLLVMLLKFFSFPI